MNYEVNYKLNTDNTFSIIFEDVSYETSLTLQKGVENLCKSIQIFINTFSSYDNFDVKLKISDEYPAIGIIVDLCKGTEDEPFGVAHYMFDDYNY